METSWVYLSTLIEIYNLTCRIFRNNYKWSPLEVDKISLSRINRIVDETIEDNKKSKGSMIDEEEFE